MIKTTTPVSWNPAFLTIEYTKTTENLYLTISLSRYNLRNIKYIELP